MWGLCHWGRLAGLLGATAGVAHASVGKAAGYVTVASCNSANGTVKYTPGLTSVSQNTTAALSGFVAGCGNLGGKQPGFGKAGGEHDRVRQHQLAAGSPSLPR